jgi:Glu-tRNA(Gln) amidotransferase subunit E-like FAD-binding protein
LTHHVPEAIATAKAVDRAELSTDELHEVLRRHAAGEFAKEGLTPVLRALVEGQGTVASSVASTGLAAIPRAELERTIDEIVAANAELIARRGSAAFSGLMGDVMKAARGRWDGREIAELLRAAIDRAVEGGSGPR